MSYLVFQIWVFLLLTAIVGLIMGWLLRGSSKSNLAKMDANWAQRIATVDAEKDDFSRKVDELTATNTRQSDMYLKLSQERDVLAERLQAFEATHDHEDMASIKHLLSVRTDEVEQMKKQLATTTEQLVHAQNSLQGGSDGVTPEISIADVNKLEVKLASVTASKDELMTELSLTQEKAQQISNSLQEAERQVQEYEEQLTCSENTLGNISSELQQKQEFFDVVRGELDRKINLRNEDLAAAQATINEQKDSLHALAQIKAESDQALNAFNEKEAEQKQQINALEQALQQAQDVLSDTSEKYNALEQAFLASEQQENHLLTESGTVEMSHDYSGASLGGQSSNMANFGHVAHDHYEKMQVTVENIATEVISAPVVASPDDENYRIEVIHSISQDHHQQLDSMGIKTTLNLLEVCVDDAGVDRVSKTLGRESWVVSSWVSIADLLRIKGIDGSMAEILELSGVYSAKALAAASPEKLIQSIDLVNRRVEKLPSVPDIATVASWVRHAETLKKHV